METWLICPPGSDTAGPNTMEETYGQKYRDLYRRHWWWRARETYVLRHTHRLLQPPARMLDIGCGDGLMWDQLENYGHVEGIETDERLVSPNAPWADRIEIASLLEGKDRPELYDLIYMLDVLEHIENDAAALDRVFSLLKPGGHLILTVPALMWLWSEFDTMNGHFRRYTRKTLRKVFDSAGFETKSIRYYYLWPVAPLLLRRAFFKAEDVDGSRFVDVPPSPINATLRGYSKIEHLFSEWFPLPCGSSIIAVARRT